MNKQIKSKPTGLSRRGLRVSISAVVTALVLAIVVLFNVMFSGIGSKYGFYIDMTYEDLYSLSGATFDIMADLPQQINIIFCHDPDYIESNEYTRLIYNTALELDRSFDNVTVKNINTIKDPTAVQQYKMTAASKISPTSVIVESGSEFRVFSYQAFFVADEDGTIWAYNAEETFVAAFLAVTASDRPIAYLTTGHGESYTTAFYSTLERAGYEIKAINLTSEDFDFENGRLVIIGSPLYDFISDTDEGSDVSELEKIDKFLASYNSLIVFLDPDTPTLKNLGEYLAEWGVAVADSVVEDRSQAVSIDGYSIVANYSTEDTLGASLCDDISSLATAPKTILQYCAPITVTENFTEVRDDEGKATGSYANSSGNAARDVSAVLFSSGEAVAKRSGNETDAAAPYMLMSLSRETRILNDDVNENEYYYSYVLVCGTSEDNYSEYINSNVYANEDLMYSAFRLMGRAKVPAGIDFKVFSDYKIENMTTAQANTWTVVLVATLPVIAAVIGFVVCVRRKYL